jgi:hypothetical protein
VDGQISYLESQETAVVVDFCMRLLQLYSSHNIGKVLFVTAWCLIKVIHANPEKIMVEESLPLPSS